LINFNDSNRVEFDSGWLNSRPFEICKSAVVVYVRILLVYNSGLSSWLFKTKFKNKKKVERKQINLCAYLIGYYRVLCQTHATGNKKEVII